MSDISEISDIFNLSDFGDYERIKPPSYAVDISNNSLPDTTNIALFNNKFILNVLQNSSNINSFSSRLKYNTRKDSYYEHDETEKVFLNEWSKGTLAYDNIRRNIEYDWQMCYLARKCGWYNDLPASIKWKFDYRLGNFLIKTLSLKLKTDTFDEKANVTWMLRLLPTQSNAYPKWNTLAQSDTNSHIYDRYMISDKNSSKCLNDLIRGQYGFMLKATLAGGTTHYSWQKTQIFRQRWLIDDNTLTNNNDDSFSMDIKVELQSDIVCDTLPSLSNSTGESKELTLNDMGTSNFTIILEDDMVDDEGRRMKVGERPQKNVFYVHSSVLSDHSEYFNALLSSNMIESQCNSLNLKEIPYSSLLVILEFMYKGNLPKYNTKEDWISLLYIASRFLIPTLMQRCEKALKEHIMKDEKCVEEVQSDAIRCGANQLLHFIDNMKLKEIDEEDINSPITKYSDVGEDKGLS